MKKSFLDLESVHTVEKDVTFSQEALDYSGAEKLTRVFKSEPKISKTSNSQMNCQSIETWKTLKPITLYEIIKNSDAEVDFTNNNSEYLDYDSKEFVTNGLFKKDCPCESGVARVVYKDTNLIKEGQFSFGQLNGYGRICFPSKYAYYLGTFKNDMFHGSGKLVHLNGKVQQGLFKKN